MPHVYKVRFHLESSEAFALAATRVILSFISRRLRRLIIRGIFLFVCLFVFSLVPHELCAKCPRGRNRVGNCSCALALRRITRDTHHKLI